jgi:hypothetical protein
MNKCLLAAGQAPVDSIEDQDFYASSARAMIENKLLEIQSRDWWFNKEKNWKLPVDPTTGFVYTPANAVAVIPYGGSKYNHIVLRGQQLYDTDDHTYDLSHIGTEITVDFRLLLDYSLVPISVKLWATALAVRDFVADIDGDVSRYQILDGRAQTAQIQVEKDQLAMNPVGMNTHNRNIVALNSFMAGGSNAPFDTNGDHVR